MAGASNAIVVMGVSASGKSVVGVEIARRMQIPFVDADDLHPPENIAKMASGTPLSDDDRMPWLDLVGARLAGAGADASEAGGVVIACSALRRSYRDRLRAHAPAVAFVHLVGAPEVLRARASARTGHFMPPTLLASQLATLEPLGADEQGITVDVDADIAAVAGHAVDWLTGAGRSERPSA